MITVGQLGVAYGLDLFDFERGTGLAVINGTGGLLAVMDARLDLRWALSLEGPLVYQPNLRSFFEAVAYLDVPVVAYLIFMGLTDPAAAGSVLEPLAGRLEYHANADLPGRGVPLGVLLRD